MVLPGVAPYFHPGYYGPYHYAAGQHPYYGDAVAAAAHAPFPLGPGAAHVNATPFPAFPAASVAPFATTTTTIAAHPGLPAALPAVAPPVGAGALVPATAAAHHAHAAHAAAALSPYNFGAAAPLPFGSVTTTESHSTSFGQTTTVRRSF